MRTPTFEKLININKRKEVFLFGFLIFAEKLYRMTAAIDLGNTSAKIAFFNNNEFMNAPIRLPLAEIHDYILHQKPKQIIISSVIQSKTALETIFQDYPQKLILSADTNLPIKRNYETPETLGTDRIAAAVGANFLFPQQNCLIIDMGTAIKYDYVTADGTFQGGIISPGKRIRFEALHSFTKRLPLVSEEGLPDLIGKSTKTCIQSGVINGILAEINGMIENYKKLGECQVILCGGDAPFFESQIKKPNFANPDLVLIGLNQILHYQS